jgi:hypothetical protein
MYNDPYLNRHLYGGSCYFIYQARPFFFDTTTHRARKSTNITYFTKPQSIDIVKDAI